MSGRGAGLRGDAVLLSRFVLGSRSAMRFCCRVLSSVHACCLCVPVGIVCSFAMSGRGAGLRGDAVLLSRFVLGSRLSFFLCQEKRDGLRCLAFLFRRSRSPFVRSRSVGAVIGFGWFTSGLCVSLWRSRRVTGDAGLRGNGAGGAALVRFCAATLALLCFPPGVRWGCAPQTCAKESSTLWTLFTLRRGYVGTNTHPCKKRKRPNQRTHACKTRVHGKTRPALIYGRAGRAVLRCSLHAQSSRLEPPPSGAESGCVREAVCQRALPAVERMCMNSSPVMVSFSLRNLASACSSVMCALKSVQACS